MKLSHTSTCKECDDTPQIAKHFLCNWPALILRIRTKDWTDWSNHWLPFYWSGNIHFTVVAADIIYVTFPNLTLFSLPNVTGSCKRLVVNMETIKEILAQLSHLSLLRNHNKNEMREIIWQQNACALQESISNKNLLSFERVS